MDNNTIQPILDNHSIEVSGLLRKYKIPGDLSIDTIKKGYDRVGEEFMMELLQIITPNSKISNFTTLSDYENLGASFDSTLAPISENKPTTAETGGWGFWDNLLNYATKTGTTIGTVKNDITGKTAADTVNLALANQAAATNNNILYFVAAGFILLIVIILIMRK